jgi:hypothetical protein
MSFENLRPRPSKPRPNAVLVGCENVNFMFVHLVGLLCRADGERAVPRRSGPAVAPGEPSRAMRHRTVRAIPALVSVLATGNAVTGCATTTANRAAAEPMTCWTRST